MRLTFVKMKRFLSLILTLSFSTSTLFSAFVLVDYFLHYSYYSEVLCVNKDKPQLKCNGKCHLALAEKAQEKEKAPLPKLFQFEVEATSPIFTTSKSEQFSPQKAKHPFFIQKAIKILTFSRLLRPPQFQS